jgi:ribonuclease HII
VLYYERKLKSRGFEVIIGIDEAGRGPLAGPVVAAAVWLKAGRFKNRIDDSKKLSPAQRESAFGEIVSKSVFGLGIVSEKTIDRLNILRATLLAMEKAAEQLMSKLNPLKLSKAHILVDGKNIKLKLNLPVTNVIKGDTKSKSIAAASILAKVTRDRIMSAYDRMYPGYGFLKHKGYPTQDHRLALVKLGASLVHRRSFCGVLS